MNKVLKSIVIVIIFALLLPMEIGYVKMIPIVEADPVQENDFRGLWVATVLNIDYPSKPTTDVEILKEEAIKILDDAKNLGMGAVFLQVRPSGDALYNSEYYPWSKYLTGKQGQAPANDFDPLMFWTMEAHKRGIELHAWINPYRVTKKTVSEAKHDFASLDIKNPAVTNPGWVVKHSDGNLYLNPGLPEVREYIINSVVEIMDNYDVDGIHMDDYFYPGNSFADYDTYKKYGEGFQNIEDWRRENVNILVKELYETIKAHTKSTKFGISPFGIWANSKSNSLGSDTNGGQSYYEHYADTRKWVKEGILDYIAPQLYWNIGFKIADYEKLAYWWADAVKDTGVDLYVGQAAYRVQKDDPKSPWYVETEMEKQFNLNAGLHEIKGSILYNYSSLAKMPELFSVIQNYNKRVDEAKECIPITIGVPGTDIKTIYNEYYICGSSDPDRPLWINGETVRARSSEGFYGVLVKLDDGENIFTLTQESREAVVKITKTASLPVSVKMKEAVILAGSTFPQNPEYKAPGEKITLSCQGPIGSKVEVVIGGKSYAMNPSSTKASGDGIYSTTFTCVYTIPSYTGSPRIIDLGAPLYKMNYKGIVSSIKAPANVGVIMKGSPYYAEIIKDNTYTYSSPNSGSGGIHELQKGMVDYITGITGNYVRLSIGHWVDKNKVKIYSDKNKLYANIKKAEYTAGETWEELKLYTATPSLAIANYENNELSLTIVGLNEGTIPKLPQDALVSAIEVNNGKYVLKFNDKISGYYIEKTKDGLVLRIRRMAKVKEGEFPLEGIVIMLDPGHGGDSLGAVGPLGAEWAEKVININTAMKLKKELEDLGAKVLMTRTEDVDVSLEERLNASKAAKPDLFISLHANSMESNVDISKVDGFSIFYRDNHAYDIAGEIHKSVIETLNRNDKGIHSQKFYIFRGTWSPSILIESGFVPNPYEFQWLIDEEEQAILAKNFARAILEYYKKGN